MCRVGSTGSNLSTRNREALQPSPLPYIRFLTFPYLLQDLENPAPRYSHPLFHAPHLCAMTWDWTDLKLGTQGGTGSQTAHPPKQGKVGYSQGAQPGEQFWLTQSKPPTRQLWSDTCVCSSRCHQQRGTFYWVTASTKLVTLQTVQPQQPQE